LYTALGYKETLKYEDFITQYNREALDELREQREIDALTMRKAAWGNNTGKIVRRMTT